MKKIMINISWIARLLVFAAVVGATRGWNVGVALKYQLVSSILSREAGNAIAGGDVGFQLTSDLNVAAVWHDPKDPTMVLLKIQVRRENRGTNCFVRSL